jgi:Na+/melibiose symporter-like transporter
MLSRQRLIPFVSPCLPLAALGLPLVVFLPEFYARHIGLPLAVVGTIFMVVRLADIAVDPLLGLAMDRTRSRFGRFRPWMVAGTSILMLTSGFVFLAQPGASAVYLAGWLAALAVGYSLCTVAQQAWAARLSADYDQRSRVYAWWQGANILGMVLVLTVPSIAGLIRPDDGALGVASMGVFVIVVLPLTVAWAAARTPEPVAAARSSLNFSQARQLAMRPAVARILLADLALGMAPGVTGALFLFFFGQARGYSPTESNLLLLAFFVAGLLGAPIWPRLSKAVGKHRALTIASLYGALALIGALILPHLPFPLIIGAMMLAGLPYAAGPLLLRSMIADAADEARLETGRDDTGLLYALVGAASKIGYAVAVGLSYFVLDAVGFQAAEGAVNAAASIRGLEWVYIAGSSGFLILGGLIVWGHPLDRIRHGEIRAALETQT